MSKENQNLQLKDDCWNSWAIPEELKQMLSECKEIIFPESRQELIDLSVGGKDNTYFEINYQVEGMGLVNEGNIVRCKNGIAVNFPESYMRRRDPDCMLVNNMPKTDKLSYVERYNKPFDELRDSTIEWLKNNELIVLPFMAGGKEFGYPALLVAPKNAAFFAASLYDLQGSLDIKSMESEFQPRAIVYLAPPFRHTHFNGKQMVIHNNKDGIHEIFSYNLYLGPSAKKGIYSVLLSIGVEEGWVTVHGSSVKVITPYDNEVSFLHEGASGSGKSEMLEYAHRKSDGRLLLGENLIDGDKKYATLNQSCKLRPVTDDMALCHPRFQTNTGKLVVADAEEAWFIRINHIQKYGTDPNLENLTIHSKEPLIFLNINGYPHSTCLIWEHIEDKPGVLCPNPRVIVPRHSVKGIHNAPLEIDYRTFGLRAPSCTESTPSYGIFGIIHLLPPALGWLWRLVAPRGFSNPSIIDTNDLVSEGVGSYWPFATGRRVDHANLLLDQVVNTPKTRYILVPNQHIGAWKVGFMPQWIMREYLARRGHAAFPANKIKPARSALGGYVIKNMQFEGSVIPEQFLEVNTQPEVGNEGYDKGAKILHDFFCEELRQFLVPDLNPLGKEIINCCLDNGNVEDYEKLIFGKWY